jgi:hypothetical protein
MAAQAPLRERAPDDDGRECYERAALHGFIRAFDF